ncbi:MAG: glycosyltransferase family 2 protein [Betaproteobacteria bacterium]|nr:glycosyltransferase family 2 protein [Betaproteobacteria bacterium]
MNSAVSSLAWFFISYGALVALFYAFVAVRIVQMLTRAPRVRDGLAEAAPPEGWPLVSIVVPAHNEERVIATCVASLLASDYPELEVVVVLDRCSDRSRELLRPFAERDARLRIIENATCPPDWAGKCNAARVGAEVARGEYLLFTDADVRFDPSLVRAAVGLQRRDRRGLLSLLPRVVAATWVERIVQPIAAMTLMQMYPIDKVNREYRRRPFANGQFMLFERSVYERIGGHAATKNDLLEDIAFARLVDASGARVGLAIAVDMLEVHMYSSYAALHEGWKRIFIEASRRRVRQLREKALLVLALGVGTPIAQIGAIAAGAAAGETMLLLAGAVVACGIGAQAVALAVFYRTGRSLVRDVVSSPVGAALVARMLWQGAEDLAGRRPVRWGGREYRLIPEDGFAGKKSGEVDARS